VKKAIIAQDATQNTSQGLVHKGITAPKERCFHTSSLVHLEHIITEHGEQRSRIVSVAPRDNIAPLKDCHYPMLHVLLAISVGEMELWPHQIKEEMLTSALLDIIVQKELENQTIVQKEHLEMTQATRMSVNVGTVLLVFTVLSQGAIPLLVLVMLDITVQLVQPAQGRFLVPLEHTVKEQAKNPNCVRVELTNQTSQEPALMTASVALQGFTVLHLDLPT